MDVGFTEVQMATISLIQRNYPEAQLPLCSNVAPGICLAPGFLSPMASGRSLSSSS